MSFFDIPPVAFVVFLLPSYSPSTSNMASSDMLDQLDITKRIILFYEKIEQLIPYALYIFLRLYVYVVEIFFEVCNSTILVK